MAKLYRTVCGLIIVCSFNFCLLYCNKLILYNLLPLLGSRFKMTSEFGFVTLDLIEVYERDQGIYTCKASNLSGEAFTSTTVYCTSKEGLIESTQHPKGEEGLEKIQELEESLKREQIEKADQELGQAPKFTSEVVTTPFICFFFTSIEKLVFKFAVHFFKLSIQIILFRISVILMFMLMLLDWST